MLALVVCYSALWQVRNLFNHTFSGDSHNTLNQYEFEVKLNTMMPCSLTPNYQFEFWMVCCVVCSNWSEWLVWFLFEGTQLKAATMEYDYMPEKGFHDTF